MERDYVVSTQLLDRNGVLLAQHDSPPVCGDYPTPSWLAGEVVDDRHAISLPAETAPGRYSLPVVVHDQETGQRLVVTDAGGKVVGDAVALSSVWVN